MADHSRYAIIVDEEFAEAINSTLRILNEEYPVTGAEPYWQYDPYMYLKARQYNRLTRHFLRYVYNTYGVCLQNIESNDYEQEQISFCLMCGLKDEPHPSMRKYY